MRISSTSLTQDPNTHEIGWMFRKKDNDIHVEIRLPGKRHPKAEKDIQDLENLNETQKIRLAHSVLNARREIHILLAAPGVPNYETLLRYPMDYGLYPGYYTTVNILPELENPILDNLDWWNHLTPELVAGAQSQFLLTGLRDPLAHSMRKVAIIQGLGKHLTEEANSNLQDDEELLLLAYNVIPLPKKPKGLMKATLEGNNEIRVQRERWNAENIDTARFMANAPKSVREKLVIADEDHLEQMMEEMNQPFTKGKFTKAQIEFLPFIHIKLHDRPKSFIELFRSKISRELCEAAIPHGHHYDPWLTPDIILRTGIPQTVDILNALRFCITNTKNQRSDQRWADLKELWEENADGIHPFLPKLELSGDPSDPNISTNKLREDINLHLTLFDSTGDVPLAWIENPEYFPKIAEDLLNRSYPQTIRGRRDDIKEGYLLKVIEKPNSNIARALHAFPNATPSQRKRLGQAIAALI